MTEELIRRSLTLCLRGRWEPVALEAAREPGRADDCDWDAWCEAAEAEGLSPLLYRILRGRDLPPPEVEAGLRAAYRRSAARNALVLRDLADAVRRLAGAGVSVLLLKGAALAATVYEDPALRPMADLDLLLHQADVPAALGVLRARGYQAADLETHAGLALEFENEMLLQRPASLPIPLELHWSLLDSPHHQRLIPMEWCWQTSLSCLLPGKGAGGEVVRVLGAEAQVLHLCAHLALHHRGEGLLWHHDVAEVLHFYRDRLDWELLLAKAAEYDLVLPLQQILPRVIEGWGAPAPAGILERLHGLEPSPEEVRVFKRRTASERPVAQRFWADLASTPGWRLRFRYGLGNLFPAPRYMRQRYGVKHDFLLPLYYPYRWVVGLRSAIPLLRTRRGDMS